MSESTPYLDVQNLTKSFGVRVLFRNLTFSISEGQHAALIAKNGSGKSTLLSILNGIEGSDEGSIVYKRDLKIGYLEQTPKFNPEESVLDACFNHQGIEERILNKRLKSAYRRIKWW
jgi:ATP-binding cassette subfamily F protein uup